MIPNLFLILALGVHDDFGKHLGQDVFEQLGGELEASPAVSLFQYIQHVTCSASLGSAEEQNGAPTERELTIELVFSVKVSVVEDLHGDLLLVVVLDLEVRVIGDDEFLDVNGGDGNLLVLPLAIDTHESPIPNSQRNPEDSDKEDIRFESAIANDGQNTFQHPRNAEDDGGQVEVVEVPVTLGDADKGGIFYGRGLGYLHGRIDHGCRA
jgi:hypothetical protein